MPADINDMTKASVKGLAGQGLIGVARDNYGRKGNTQSWVASFAEVEVDVETGEYRLVDYIAATDCGTVINPRGLAGQLHGGGVQGFGQIKSQKWVYDQRYGVSLANRFHYNKPPTILDIPLHEMAVGRGRDSRSAVAHRREGDRRTRNLCGRGRGYLRAQRGYR